MREEGLAMKITEALRKVLLDLNGIAGRGGVERFALIGGLGIAIWGRPRATNDIDLLVSLPGTTDGKKLEKELTGLGWELDRRSPS